MEHAFRVRIDHSLQYDDLQVSFDNPETGKRDSCSFRKLMQEHGSSGMPAYHTAAVIVALSRKFESVLQPRAEAVRQPLTPEQTFAEAPPTITELRSERSQDAADWTPRDALVHLLRKIDSGEIIPEAAVVIVAEGSDEGYRPLYISRATRDRHESAGLLYEALHDTVSGGRD